MAPPSCSAGCSTTGDSNMDAVKKFGGSGLRLLPLVAVIFYEVSGGPFGVEETVKAGGPLLAVIGFAVLPFVWSIPEALITAELATAMPANGGYVLWVSAAFGPFWGFQEGFWKWFSGVMDNALYPVLFLDYLKHSIPIFARGAARTFTLLGITLFFTLLNYRGLTIVGYSAVGLAAFSLLPFLVMSLLAIPRIKPRQWGIMNVKDTDWRAYANSLFWNLNFWDSVSTLAGEVEKPRVTFPKALLTAVVLVVLSYLIPLLAGTGAFPVETNEWDDGYFAEVAKVIGGTWLKWWIQAAAALSNMGLFEAEMSTDSFQLLGMSENGMLPKLFSYRSRYGTPTFGILCSALGVISLSWMDFLKIVEFVNFLYSIGMLLEFAAFIWLRIKHPELNRPYKIPLNTFFATLMFIPPCALLILVMKLASLTTLYVSSGFVVAGLILYPLVQYVKGKKWLQFCESINGAPSTFGLVDISTPELEDAMVCSNTSVMPLNEYPNTPPATIGVGGAAGEAAICSDTDAVPIAERSEMTSETEMAIILTHSSTSVWEKK